MGDTITPHPRPAVVTGASWAVAAEYAVALTRHPSRGCPCGLRASPPRAREARVLPRLCASRRLQLSLRAIPRQVDRGVLIALVARPTAVARPVLGPTEVLDRAAPMARLRAGEEPVGLHQLRAVPAGLVAELPTNLGESRVRKSATSCPGPRQPLLAEHLGGVQPLHHDPAVGLGQPGGEPMDLVLPDGGDVRVELRSAPFLAPAAVRAALAAGDGPGEPTQHGQVPGQGGRVRNPLDLPRGGGHRGQPTHADVDAI